MILTNLFVFLFLVSFICLIIGLINPSAFDTIFKKKLNRKNIGLIFGTALIAFFILIGADSSSTSKETPNQEADKPIAQKTTQAIPKTNPVSKTTASTSESIPTPTTPSVVLDISGSGSKSTQTFEVNKEWQIKWSYDCSNWGYKGAFSASIYNADGSLSFDNSMINQSGTSGSDTEYYHKGGKFYLVVNSVCDWSIKIQS